MPDHANPRRERDRYDDPERRRGRTSQTPDDPEFGRYRPDLGRSADPGGDWQQPGPYSGYGPRSYRRSDDDIRDEVCERLTRHGEIDAREIEIQVEDGEVTLKGMVDSRPTKRLAEQVADSVRGVRDVHNQLVLNNAVHIREGQGMTTGYGRIEPGLHVVSSDGKTIGRVKEVRESHFLVDRPMSRDIFIPFEACTTVSQHWLGIYIPAADVDRQGWPQAR